MPMPLKDLTGQKFGRRTVVKRASDKVRPNGKRDVFWECGCDCGKIDIVKGAHLKLACATGCQSCTNSAINKHSTHKMSGTRVYKIWEHVKQRCVNSNYDKYCDYGGRGITICEEWGDFQNFYADMGDPPQNMTLDRIDVNKGYYKNNCRWATRAEQSQNQRRTILNWAAVADIRNSNLTPKQLSEKYKINLTSIYGVLNHKNWKVE